MHVTKEKSQESPRTPNSARYNSWGTRGAKMDSGNPKTDLDWIIYHAKDIPGPGHYGSPRLPGMKLSGGSISQANVKSEIDWITLNAKHCPGPADYSPRLPDQYKNKCRFSTAKPKSSLEWTIHFAKQRPGPAQYHPDVSSIAVRAGIVQPGENVPVKTYSMRVAERKAEEAAQDAERKRALAAAAAAGAEAGEDRVQRDGKEKPPSLSPVKRSLRPMKRRTDDSWHLHTSYRRGVVQDGPLELEDFDLSVAVDRMRFRYRQLQKMAD